MICFGRCFCKFRKKDGKELISEYFCEMKKGWVRIIFFFYRSEAVVQRCSVKKMFLKISQNSQENTCGRVSILINLQSLTQVFSREFCGISKNNFFYRISLVAASGSQTSLSQIQSYWDALDVLYIWYQN